MKTIYSAQQGFTLIELAMVLFILGLLLSSFLAPLAARVEQQERNNTQIQLDEIEEVIYGYALQNNYLPCPDCSDNTGGCAAATAGDGQEDRTVGVCASEIGNLPWVTLGVKGTDEWNNIFTYRVDDVFADSNTPASDGTPLQPGCAGISATLNVSFSLCSDGEIIVLNTAGAGGGNLALNIPAIVVSHGKNWPTNPPASADEIENTDPDITFVSGDFSANVVTGFDDMVIWISPHVLRTMSVKAGILP